jgi:mRNA-degrading endonuclease RelE of RelBE toxin-antitoxin system
MYSIQIEKNAEDFLKKIQKNEAEIILKKIYSIRGNPFRFLKRLEGHNLWRLRVTDYRVIMDVIVSGQKIIVLRIGKREKMYNKI